MQYAIVVVGYNRIDELKRVLKSVSLIRYERDNLDLYVSLDFSDKQRELTKIAEDIDWKYGKKHIRLFEEKQGLRNHIIQCGDLTNTYDAVIVLEDDIVVSDVMMEYVVQVVEKYNDDERIAGISLYTHRTNPGNGRFFEAQYNGYDVFFMQYAQSWGQCWTKKMWKNFRSWYNSYSDNTHNSDIPQYVRDWNEQSWLKYYIEYTVEKDKYFVYPYFSISTNCSAAGEHNKMVSSAYQVPLQYDTNNDYRMPDVDSAVKYDVYFERIWDNNYKTSKKIIMDLYGLKTDYSGADILYSTNVLPFKIIKEIGLTYRPIEYNYIMQEIGRGIFVYDLHERSKNNSPKNLKILADYDIRTLRTKYIIICTIQRILRKFLR